MPSLPRPTLEYAQSDRRSPPRGALATLLLVIFADMLGFGVIIPSLPLYAEKYGATPLQVGLLFTLYSACQFLASPIMGLLSDRFGRRPVLAVSQVGTVAGYLLLGYAMLAPFQNPQTALWLIYLSRVIDGISGGNISTAHAYIGDISDSTNRAARMGLMGAAFGVGFSAGPAIGGGLSLIHPAAPAFGAAALTAVALVLTIVLLPESRRPGASSDDAAVSWMHPSRFMPVLRNPVLGQMMFIGFFSMLAFVMLEPFFALYLNGLYGLTQAQVNWFFAFVGLTIVIVQGGLIGPLTRRFGEWPLTIAGPLIAAASQGMFVAAVFDRMLGVVIFASVINAVGRSIWFPTLNSLMSRHATPDTQGVTFGVFHSMMSLSRVIGPMLAGIAFAKHASGPFILAGGILLAVGLWTLQLRARAAAREQAGKTTDQPPQPEALAAAQAAEATTP
jgi:DHA1 family tetracycline resistance protein-like MFS transporter